MSLFYDLKQLSPLGCHLWMIKPAYIESKQLAYMLIKYEVWFLKILFFSPPVILITHGVSNSMNIVKLFYL